MGLPPLSGVSGMGLPPLSGVSGIGLPLTPGEIKEKVRKYFRFKLD